MHPIGTNITQTNEILNATYSKDFGEDIVKDSQMYIQEYSRVSMQEKKSLSKQE